MNAPISWLSDYVTIGIPLSDLADRLVRSGLEVDRITTRGAPDTDSNHDLFRIGRVVWFDKHPNADRLRLCRVDVGEPEPRQIVCGASNFTTGDTVVVALPGAWLPGASEPLRRAKLRSEVSDGMMLSERELELSAEHAGIITLPDRYEIGSLARDHFALADTILELEVTANRSDLLSIYGIAREIAALTGADLAPLPGVLPAATGTRPFASVCRVAIDAPDRCYRFTARGFDDVRVAPSPLLLRQRVAACGMRPISNVVDITNYVMLGIGNPTHAYDTDRIRGGELTARLARSGDTLTTLDERERRLSPDTLVIADAAGPSGIAGIIGGAASEITETTSRVVIEAANFERSGIQRTSVALAVRTDSAARWMRGVDPYLAPHASAWAAQLLVEHAAAVMLPGDADVIAYLPQRETITLRDGRAETVLGMPISRADSTRVLAALGYEPEPVADGVRVAVPTWRWLDTTREIDLVEEVGRIHGLEKLPATIPSRTDAGGALSRSQQLRRLVEDALCGVGAQECVTVSLVDTATLGELGVAADDPRRAMIALRNPLSAEYAYLRRTLLPSLLRVARRNASVGGTDAALFEIAHLYHAPGGIVNADTLAQEPWTLGVVLAGRLGGSSWAGDGPTCDFFCAKGVLGAVTGRLGVSVTLASTTRPYLHPGRAAVILAGEPPTAIGEIGELHPVTVERFGLNGRVSVIELDVDQLISQAPDRFAYQPVASQPPVRQDIAVVVSDQYPAGDVIAVVREAGAPLLAHAEVFDVYRDADRLGGDRRSLAIRLVFQAPDRTLTDDQASTVRKQIVAALTQRFSAELRGA
jgi:phenylalanyl-tRNA synthetase beta chain